MKARGGRLPVLLLIGTFITSGLLTAGVSLRSTSDVASAAAVQPNGFTVGQAYMHAVTPALRDIPPLHPQPAGPHEVEDNVPSLPITGHRNQPDSVVQRSFGARTSTASASTAGAGWDGISAANPGCNSGCAPPDTNGDVGPNYYVQAVNIAFQVWNKTGTSLYGPASINTLWQSLGGPCATRNDGDPIVLYDSMADRWLISQFTSASPYDECMAVSKTADPTGQWNLYAFQLSTSLLQDYPKLGIWPDGYYMSVNTFACTSSFLGVCLSYTYQGPQAYVFDRARMLAGASTAGFQAPPALASSHNPLLPADLDGTTLPPSGSPEIFAEDGSSLGLWKFHVDWTTPSSSSFTNSASLATAPWTEVCPNSEDCIPQPGTTQKIDDKGDRLMYRLAYRNFGDHDALVVNHTVDAGGGQSGIRWYEIRNPISAPAIYQQGSYAPDSTDRWMGSGAMDSAGDLAIGYSAGSASTYPSIRYAGRLSTDPLGQLPQGETTLLAGTGSQTSPNRWGDYSALQVDPSDDCTFWYTNEYYGTSGSNSWKTRIGSFKFPNCGSSPKPVATLSVTSAGGAVTGSPVNVTVTARDAGGNTATGYTGTVHFTSSDGQAVLPADYAFTAADNGVHSFPVTFNSTGSQTVTATDTVTATIAGSATVSVSAPTSNLDVSAPGGTTAGASFNLTVTARDGSGGTAAGYTGTVHFTSGDAQAVLPANYAFTSSDAGVHTFAVTLKTAGSQTIGATDTGSSGIAGSSGQIAVSAAPASKLLVTTGRNSVTAGNPLDVSVAVRDAYGNLATGYTGMVHFTSGDAQAALPANYAFTGADAGTHTFTTGLTFKTAGSQTVTAADTASSSISGTSSAVTVAPAGATRFVVSTPSSATGGKTFTFTVTAKDAYGNTANGYQGTAHFISSDARATLPPDYGFTSVDAGAHSFSATLNTVGSQTITVTDTQTASIAGTSGTITVQTVPDPPTGASATGANKQAKVKWSPPTNNGGSAITGYTVTTYSGTSTSVVKTTSASTSACTTSGSLITCTASVSGLKNGSTYSFTVKATNAVGASAESSRSNAVTL